MNTTQEKIISRSIDELSSIKITGQENKIEEFHKIEQMIEVFRKLYNDAYLEGKKDAKIEIEQQNKFSN